mgnify:FL=1
MKRKKILSAILILGIIGAFIAYKIYNKPHVNVANSKVDISLTANKILNDFSTDENDANAKYLEKIIEVKGEIVSLKTEKGLGIISLKTNDDFGTVLCHLSEESTRKMRNFKEGQTISVKGICTGYLMDVILVKSEILTN